jgi:hypothetical protein
MTAVRIGFMITALGAGCSSCASRHGTVFSDGAPSGGASGEVPDFLLYDAGSGLGSPIYGLQVDARGVYWVQRDGGIHRGSRDGR